MLESLAILSHRTIRQPTIVRKADHSASEVNVLKLSICAHALVTALELPEFKTFSATIILFRRCREFHTKINLCQSLRDLELLGANGLPINGKGHEVGKDRVTAGPVGEYRPCVLLDSPGLKQVVLLLLFVSVLA